MKKIILFFVSAIMFISCSEDDGSILSNNTKIESIIISSREYDKMENVFFEINEDTGEIYNTTTIPKSVNLRMLKFRIDTYPKALIKINNNEWNGIDSINYASLMQIQIIAENNVDKKDYILKINKEDDISGYLEDYNAYSYGRLSDTHTNNTIFFNIDMNNGKGFLTNGEVGRNKWGLWYTAPFDCIANVTYSITNNGNSKEPICEILDQRFNVIYSKRGLDYTNSFEIYLKKGKNIKLRITADQGKPQNFKSDVVVQIKQ